MLQLKLSESTAARRRIPFRLRSDADYRYPLTGVVWSAADIQVSKNGAAEGNSGGSVTEIGGGAYYYAATAGELDTLGYLALRIIPAGAAPVDVDAQVVAFDPYDATALGLSRLDAAVSADSAGVTTLLSRLTSGRASALDFLDMALSTIYAAIDTEVAAIFNRIGAPAGASLSADVAAVNAKTTNLPASPAAVGSAMTLTSGERTSIAEAIFKLDLSTITGEASRSLLNAVRFLRNKWAVAAGVLTVKKEDDSTTAWTADLTSDAAAEPVVGVDPS